MPRLGKTGSQSRRAAALESMRQAWIATFRGVSAAPEARATEADAADVPVGRVSWRELCESREFAGGWVALDDVRYQDGRPLDGVLVDADRDLATLCGRVQSDEGTSCAILHCVACHAPGRRSLPG